jgi:pimeloyl-[acyl-carrier protein] methyl ester esterase
MNSAVWDGLPEAVADGRRTTRIELPGHGASPFDPAWTDRAAWARACLDAAPERAVWLAWSLGALVALEAALMAPERVTALVLVTATPCFVQAPDWPAAMPGATLDRFHDGLLVDPPGTLHRFLALQVKGSDAARETLRLLRAELSLRPAPNPAALAVGLDLLRDGDLRARLPGLACPSLWLFGERDTLVPAAAAEGVAALLSGASQTDGEQVPPPQEEGFGARRCRGLCSLVDHPLSSPLPQGRGGKNAAPSPAGDCRKSSAQEAHTPAGEGLGRGRSKQARDQFAVIPRAAHAPFLSHPQETSAAILSFLSEIEQ